MRPKFQEAIRLYDTAGLVAAIDGMDLLYFKGSRVQRDYAVARVRLAVSMVR